MADFFKKIFCSSASSQSDEVLRIVGLMPARNEGAKIEFALRALAEVTDAIVFLDDCSTDNTLSRVRGLAEICRIERILTKDEWFRDEPGDRNRLLDAGRAIGGTHFIVVDADEAFTANCLDADALRNKVLKLRPEQQMSVLWIQLWRDAGHYRVDGKRWANKYKRCIFCDNGTARYSSEFIHTSRIPKMKGKCRKWKGAHGLLHFQFANWENLILKQQWYCWLERVRMPEKDVADIYRRYSKSVDEYGLQREPCLENWLQAYSYFDVSAFDEPDNWRIDQMKGWVQEYGVAFFEGLTLPDFTLDFGGGSDHAPYELSS